MKLTSLSTLLASMCICTSVFAQSFSFTVDGNDTSDTVCLGATNTITVTPSCVGESDPSATVTDPTGATNLITLVSDGSGNWTNDYVATVAGTFTVSASDDCDDDFSDVTLTEVQLNSITPSSNATAIGSAGIDYGTIMDATPVLQSPHGYANNGPRYIPADYVTITASVVPNNSTAATLFSWGGGGQSVWHKPFKQRVPRYPSAETQVTASCCNAFFTNNIWVIWADVTVKMSSSDTLDPDDKAAVLVDGNWPSQNDNINSLGGGNHLGCIDKWTCPDLNYDTAIGKTEAKASLHPSGIGKVLTSGWYMGRMVNAITYQNAVLDYTTHGWQPDFSSDARFLYLIPTNDDLFDLDAPASPVEANMGFLFTYENYDNFEAYALVDLGDGQGRKVCSQIVNYSYETHLNDIDDTNPKADVNSLIGSFVGLPGPFYSQHQ